jgi:predicted acylesterase/phospholipase RssA
MVDQPPPKKYCDLIMKGGVTSGVVYPLAVCELASEYWFKNIGGTSAGAIAAGITAAAECGRRRSGSDAGFKQLARLPDDLKQENFLASLFKPDPDTKKVFEVVLAAMTAKQAHRSVKTAVVLKLCRNFSSSFLMGILASLILTTVLWFLVHGSVVPYVLLGTLVGVLLAAYLVVRSALQETKICLLRNFFGFSSGFDPNGRLGEAPLTNWLYKLVNDVANQPAGRPLTFGDLWNAPRYPLEPEIEDRYQCVAFENRAVNFEVMTTNLTLGCPTRIPFDSKALYFHPGELGRFFPSEVIDWMLKHASAGARPTQTPNQQKLIPLPEMQDLPVIVAIRMSLSFPVLLSAVPLYAVDYTLKKNGNLPTTETAEAERNWFSDGGITSNFPIHFFDSPLPRWPTFGIDLKPTHPDHKSEAELVWLPTSNNEGLQPNWNRFESKGLFGFAGAIINSMQNWRDNLQMLIPGYRDRVVHISNDDREGGLNLRMDADVIETMTDRGKRAGLEILNKFNWENHAWIRYRSTMCCYQNSFERFANTYSHPLPQDHAIWPALKVGGPAPSYPWRGRQLHWAPNATADFVGLILKWIETGECFCDGAPKPRPEVRISPRV